MSGFYRPKWERKWARVPRPLPVLYFERAIIARPGIFPTFRQHFIARRQTPLKILSLLISGEKPNFSYKHGQIIQMYGYERVSIRMDLRPIGRGTQRMPTTIEQPPPPMTINRPIPIESYLGWIWEENVCMYIYVYMCVYMCVSILLQTFFA